MKLCLLATTLCLTISVAAPLADNTEGTGNNKTVRVLLVGDSTVVSHDDGHPNQGWGKFFPDFFDHRVEFFNAARGGRSSKSFMESGEWKEAMRFEPDFVFIQFGHNDQPGKGPSRETDPETTYRDYLRRYIGDVRAAGAQPVLVTSVARRTFRDGKIVSSLTPWVDAMKAVGAEEKVAVIDLHGASIAFFESVGEAEGAYLNYGREGRDRTHFSETGARSVAGLVAAEVSQVAGLAIFLRNPLE
jgi:lysophospholipase L1-like esterase